MEMGFLSKEELFVIHEIKHLLQKDVIKKSKHKKSEDFFRCEKFE